LNFPDFAHENPSGQYFIFVRSFQVLKSHWRLRSAFY